MNHLGADFNHLYLRLKQPRQKCAGCFNLKLWPDTNANILFNVFLLFWKLSNGLLVTWYRIILPITSDAGSFRGGTSGSRRAEWMKFGFGEMSFRSERWNLSLRKHRHHIQTRREMRRSNLLADLDRFLLRCRGCLFQTSLALVSFHKSLKIPNVGIFPPQVLSRWRKIWSGALIRSFIGGRVCAAPHACLCCRACVTMTSLHVAARHSRTRGERSFRTWGRADPQLRSAAI